MKLSFHQRYKLRSAISEALAFKTWISLQREDPNARPTMADCEAQLAEIKRIGGVLLTSDALHAAIVDRCVDAIEEGLI